MEIMDFFFYRNIEKKSERYILIQQKDYVNQGDAVGFCSTN